MPHPTRRDWLSISALGLIWGATFMVIALALRGYGAGDGDGGDRAHNARRGDARRWRC